MKRLAPILIAAILAPALFALLLMATRDGDRLVRVQGPEPLAWLSSEAVGAAPRSYIDRQGRTWWRYDPQAGETVRIAPSAEDFPDGCEVAWFVRRGTPLAVRPSPSSELLPGPARGRVRSGKMLFHRLAREALDGGVSLELANAARLESLFVSFGSAGGCAICRDDGRSIFLALTAAFLALSVAFAMRFRATGSATAGVAAVAAAFALGALWFDSPVWSREQRIDKGDDSFYLAYAQNLVNHGTFFRAPTDISFGARHLDHCHGLPGIALMLSPTLAPRALSRNAGRRAAPINAAELRAMRATSMAYALAASLLLFGALRARRGGKAPPSVWDAAMPALLLWGTSLPRWAFVRSIFTHPAEMALLCLAIFLAAIARPRRRRLRDVALAATTGMLFLVRGEYLLVSPLFLLLPRRDDEPPAGAQPGSRLRSFISRRGAPLLVLAAFAVVYAFWVSKIGTGYGRPSDAGLPFSSGIAAVLGQIAANARTLLRSFIQNGAILPVAAALAVAAPFVPSLRRRAADLPVSPRVAACLAASLFLLNCCFSPPLGDEFGHRYALKLYPFALLWLGTLLAGPSPDTWAGRAVRCLLAALPVCALLANLRLLLRIGGTDLGQNFSMLSNLQFKVLPPSGSGAINLRLALWLLLAAWCAWLVGEAVRLVRHGRDGAEAAHGFENQTIAT